MAHRCLGSSRGGLPSSHSCLSCFTAFIVLDSHRKVEDLDRKGNIDGVCLRKLVSVVAVQFFADPDKRFVGDARRTRQSMSATAATRVWAYSVSPCAYSQEDLDQNGSSRSDGCAVAT
jgi:hypothetical protein